MSDTSLDDKIILVTIIDQFYLSSLLVSAVIIIGHKVSKFNDMIVNLFVLVPNNINVYIGYLLLSFR